jgi:hypothetical protein
MERDTRHFGRLARDGLDVYDQVGHERSSGFDDPRSYTLERDARVHHFTETLDQTGSSAAKMGNRVRRRCACQEGDPSAATVQQRY